MAPLPGRSNFALVPRDSQNFQRSIANSRHFGKNASVLLAATDTNAKNEVFIPREDKKKTNCCFYIFCPCYYLFCCCCCCENGFKVSRKRFEERFKKWVNAVSKDRIVKHLCEGVPIAGRLPTYLQHHFTHPLLFL